MDEQSAQGASLNCEELGLSGIRFFSMEEAKSARPPLPSLSHPGFMEILILHKGIQSLEVAEEEYTVMGGDIVIIPEGAPHSSDLQPQYRLNYHRLLIDVRPRTRLLGLSKAQSDECVCYLLSLTNVRYRGNPELEALIASAYENLAAPEEARKRRGRGELICFLMSFEDSLTRQTGWRDQTISAAMEYINDNITQRLELQEVAGRVGVSLSYFKAQFRKQTGVSPMYYINWRKIAYAKRLISHGYSVTETAMRLSFNSSAYFSTVFRNITSRTPLQYRRVVEEEMRKQQHLWSPMLLPPESKTSR